jgi:hypothetical protein
MASKLINHKRTKNQILNYGAERYFPFCDQPISIADAEEKQPSKIF